MRLNLARAADNGPRLLLLDEPGNGLDPVARQELLTEFMDVLRDDSRSILFSSHNTADVERISDRIAFMDRGRLLECSDREAFLERWRRIDVQLEPGAALPPLPHIVAESGEGRFRTLTTNRFDEAQLALLGGAVRGVQRMSLEEIFVANVMHHREGRAP
ncbi:ABC-2 type transport system ATP-binding protein [Luteimonas sp. J16]|nr:AAA family ATPase [Luteimonas sp. J16]TWG92716.1 ABC-2 type transport system ATP-binding protein [Luteimonas sp. J16]